ncbi:MAG: hypothetical protein ACOX2Q_01785 [Dehalobacterium sp.]|jgi:hypothetical protein
MKFMFWIFLSLFLFFLYLTINTKLKKGKMKFRFLFPTVLLLVPCVLLGGIYIIYNTELKPQPSVSTVILENKDFRIGVTDKIKSTDFAK